MREREPLKKENFIFIANHNKWLDSWLITDALQRLSLANSIRASVSDKTFKTPLGLFFKLTGNFPARAGLSFDQALKTPERYLAQGHSILIYPQGAPREGHRLTKPGARELSLRTGVPIIPILVKAPILNAKRIFLEKNEIEIIIGQPFIPRQDENVMERVWQLNNQDVAKKDIEELKFRTGIEMIPMLVRVPFLNSVRVFLRKSS